MFNLKVGKAQIWKSDISYREDYQQKNINRTTGNVRDHAQVVRWFDYYYSTPYS